MNDKAIIKSVIHSGLDAYPIIVYDCPINRKVWKGGSKKGQSYACVFDDCYKCPFGEVVCERNFFNNGDTVIDGPIKEVRCRG